MDALDSQLVLSMLGFVAAFVFGKHLQSGFAQVRARARLARRPDNHVA